MLAPHSTVNMQKVIAARDAEIERLKVYIAELEAQIVRLFTRCVEEQTMTTDELPPVAMVEVAVERLQESEKRIEELQAAVEDVNRAGVLKIWALEKSLTRAHVNIEGANKDIAKLEVKLQVFGGRNAELEARNAKLEAVHKAASKLPDFRQSRPLRAALAAVENDVQPLSQS